MIAIVDNAKKAGIQWTMRIGATRKDKNKQTGMGNNPRIREIAPKGIFRLGSGGWGSGLAFITLSFCKCNPIAPVPLRGKCWEELAPHCLKHRFPVSNRAETGLTSRVIVLLVKDKENKMNPKNSLSQFVKDGLVSLIPFGILLVIRISYAGGLGVVFFVMLIGFLSLGIGGRYLDGITTRWSWVKPLLIISGITWITDLILFQIIFP